MTDNINNLSEMFIKLREFVNQEIARMPDDEIKAIKEKYGNVKNGEL